MISEIRADMEAQVAPEDSAPSAPDVSSTPDSVDATPAESSSPEAPAAPQPSETGAAPVPSTPGPIPFDRHKAVLEETRAKYAWVDKYGDHNAVQQRLAVTEWAERDPVGFLRTYAANQGIDPRTLFPQEQAAPAPVAEPPKPDVLLENGQMVYSDERLQQLLAFQQRQMEQRFNQELAPIKQERAISQLQRQSHDHAKQQLATAKAWPGFSEHEADLKAYLVANPTATLHDAYINVVPAKLAEKAQAAETAAYQKALTDLTTKAGAASIPAPRTAGGVVPDMSKMSLRELLESAYDG